MKPFQAILSTVLAAGLFATAAEAVPLTVNNPSFETLGGGLPFNCGTVCAYSIGVIPSWTNAGVNGLFQPGEPTNTTYFNTPSSDSTPTIAFTDGGTISQTVTDTVQAGVVYTLLVDLGSRNDVGFFATADLLINGIRYAATGVAPVRGGWSTYTATYTGLVADAGQSITIELNATSAEGDFDNVRLSNDLAGPTPEPAFTSLVGMALVLFGGFRRFKRR